MAKEITIRPITRLEGHGKISIFLDDTGNVEDAYYQTVEFRGFERFCRGRAVEELPLITPRICGVCPWAHHMASSKAVDAVYNVEIPPTARKLRELAYNTFYVHDHSAVFYALSAPDFVVGPSAPKAERNVLGIAAKVGVDVVKYVLNTRLLATRILEMLGGRAIHPAMNVPGGVGKRLSEEDRVKIKEYSGSLLELAKKTLGILESVVLQNKDYVNIIVGDVYKHQTYYMGTVDGNDKVQFYDGKIKVIDPNGKEYAKFSPKDYLQHIAEHIEPWTYLKFPYLKNVGWKGLVDGVDSGIYRVGPLARINVSTGFSTPIAQEAYKKFVETLGKPAHATLGFHWARVIEIVNAAERVGELVDDPDITGPEFRVVPKEVGGEGVGIVEAPRGTLIHHYQTDKDAIMTNLNLIVATTHNNAGICLSVSNAAKKLIRNGEVNDGLLNMIEMAFRAYDPCLACGTHTLPGNIPLEVQIYNSQRKLVKVMKT